jgi:hypothetical protein
LRSLSLFAGSNEGRSPETNRQAGTGPKAAKVKRLKGFFAVDLSVEPDGHSVLTGVNRGNSQSAVSSSVIPENKNPGSVFAAGI